MEGRRAIRADRTPLFATVGEALKREIASGRFAEADVLPGERELSDMLDVSRTTLRRAIAALVDEGVLVHRHGAGTFVRRNPPHVEQPLSRLTSFTEDMRLRGLTASSRVIERGTFLPTPEESMMLDISLERDGVSPRPPAPRRWGADGVRAGDRADALSGRRRTGRRFALCGAGGGRLSARSRASAAARGRDRRRPRRRCSGFPKARPRSTFTASPMSPTAGGSNSPVRTIARTPMISSPN